jgi:hypothetical protein
MKKCSCVSIKIDAIAAAADWTGTCALFVALINSRCFARLLESGSTGSSGKLLLTFFRKTINMPSSV